MGVGTNLFNAQRFTERTLIESVLASFYILDYGFISKVNEDKTINVTHAKRLKTLNGESLSPTLTENVEVLTVCGGGFSFKFDYKKGDKVILLGLKSYVPKVEEVNSATETTAYMHYTRETMKAIPMCVFSEEAKVRVEVESGKMSVSTDNVLTLDGEDYGGLCITPELVKQLGYLTTRVDTIINALKNAQTGSQDGGAAYKAGIGTILDTIVNKEDFSNVESDKVLHGKE